MSSVPLDVWLLIGARLEVKDLRSFFSVSRVHSRVSGRDDFWRVVCLTNYGNWKKENFPGKTWREIVKVITKHRHIVSHFRDTKLKYFCSVEAAWSAKVIKLIKEHFDQFYVRSPDRATFFYAGAGEIGNVRSGDVTVQLRGSSPYIFKKNKTVSLHPPAKKCWPHVSIHYSRVGELVFVHMTYAQFAACVVEQEGSVVTLRDPRCPKQVVFMSDYCYATLKQNVKPFSIHLFDLEDECEEALHLRMHF